MFWKTEEREIIMGIIVKIQENNGLSEVFIAYLKTNKKVSSHVTNKKNEIENTVQIKITFVTIM